MKNSSLRRADMVFSIILAVVSILVMIYCLGLWVNPYGRDPSLITEAEVQTHIAEWYLSPALVPFILAFAMLICAALLFRNAWKEGARFDFFTKKNVEFFFKNRETHVATIEILILIIYTQVLIPFCRSTIDFFPRFQGFPFMIATWICLMVQMIIFGSKKPSKIAFAVVLAALVAAAITYGFGMLALIPLP